MFKETVLGDFLLQVMINNQFLTIKETNDKQLFNFLSTTLA
jgi:hypothetical protein